MQPPQTGEAWWENADFGGFEGRNWRRTCGFKDSVRFCCFLEEMPEYRVFLKVESEDAPVMLTQYYRCVFITCTLNQMFEKSNGMHSCFERNSRFWCLNHVSLGSANFVQPPPTRGVWWENADLGGFEGENWRRTCGFQRFRKILLFFGKNAGISRVFKGWIRRRTCNVDAVLQVRLHYLYVETNVWKKVMECTRLSSGTVDFEA